MLREFPEKEYRLSSHHFGTTQKPGITWCEKACGMTGKTEEKIREEPRSSAALGEPTRNLATPSVGDQGFIPQAVVCPRASGHSQVDNFQDMRGRRPVMGAVFGRGLESRTEGALPAFQTKESRGGVFLTENPEKPQQCRIKVDFCRVEPTTSALIDCARSGWKNARSYHYATITGIRCLARAYTPVSAGLPLPHGIISLHFTHFLASHFALTL